MNVIEIKENLGVDLSRGSRSEDDILVRMTEKVHSYWYATGKPLGSVVLTCGVKNAAVSNGHVQGLIFSREQYNIPPVSDGTSSTGSTDILRSELR